MLQLDSGISTSNANAKATERETIIMKRSEINRAVAEAALVFATHHWHLPPEPRWDVTGFGLGDFEKSGLVLVNLAQLPQYCEKLMYARQNQVTPMHCHKTKQEDIICRSGTFAIRLAGRNDVWGINRASGPIEVLLNGVSNMAEAGSVLFLGAGERITLYPGTYHEFWPVSPYAILGEVSTANDDATDNFFENSNVGRFETIEEDEPAIVKLVSDL